ncbi:MAG TPA: hypothetical protein VGL83_14360 [Stellaceae bacterium]
MGKPPGGSTLIVKVAPAGRLDSKALDQQIMSGGGRTTLKTVEGDMLTVTGSSKMLSLADAKGNSAMVTIADV